MNKHLKLFANHSAYSQAESNLDKPNVAVCLLEGDVHFNPDPFNGHEYVDLGLPSGTLWATMNVGASSETDYGNYYMYGMGSKTYDSTDTPYDGTENPLDLSKDTANVVWGGDWHMPTQALIEELIANTTYEWTTINGVKGGKFTNKTDSSKYIFMPAAGNWNSGSQFNVGSYGFFWGSFPNGSYGAYYLYFYGGNKGVDNRGRSFGFSVRPVVDGKRKNYSDDGTDGTEGNDEIVG